MLCATMQTGNLGFRSGWISLMLANRGRALTAAERGDRDAFLALYDQFAPMLYRFSFWLTGNEKETRELVVATFCRAFRSLHKRPRDIVLDTWFYRMAVRTFLAANRWQRFTRRTPGPVEIEDRTTAWREATLALPPRLRVVWLLALAEGMPQSQTAEALGTSLDRVESLLERARAEFRAPDSETDRAVVERAMRQLSAPRPSATLRGEVAAALGTGDATLRTRIMQAGIGLVVLALVASVAFSLLRDEEEAEVDAEQAPVQPKQIVLLGHADSGALIKFNATDLKPANIIGIGNEPRALAPSADGNVLYVLQSGGLLTVEAESERVGRLFQLPEQEWSSLVVAGEHVVVGSQSSPLVLVLDENGETAAEISLPWPVERLVQLNEQSLLAVAAARTSMVLVALDSATVGESIEIGAGLVIGAVVPNQDGSVLYVTTPETEELWRVATSSRQATLLAEIPGTRATHGALSADGAALYLSAGSARVEPSTEDSSASSDTKSSVPPVRTTSKELSDADTADEETGTEEMPPALTLVNTADGNVERQLWQEGGVTQLALDAERNILYVLAPQANAILVLDARTFHVRNVVPLAVRPLAFSLLAQSN